MRNKPWAAGFIAEQPNVSFQAHTLIDQWEDLAQKRPIYVELGSGKGDYIHQMAQLHPDVYWIAVEKDINVAATALRKIAHPVPNVFWIVQDALAIDQWFKAGSIERIYLNFSDPWPKRHHAKRRLSSERFLEKMLGLMRAEGLFLMKTDNPDLFEYTILLWDSYPLSLLEFSVDYRRHPHPEDVVTEYEQRFMELNQPIYRAVWRKQHVK